MFLENIKKVTTSVVLSIALLSCAGPEIKTPYKREIASTYESPISLVELMTIYASSNFNTKDNLLKRLKLNVQSEVVDIVYKENKMLPNDIAYQLLPVIDEKSIKIEIHYSPKAQFDKDAFEELQVFFKQLTQNRYDSAHNFFEIYYNAKNNHLPALHTLAKIRRDPFALRARFSVDEKNGGYLFYDLTFPERNTQRLAYWNDIVDQFEHLEKKEQKEIKEKTEARKLAMNRLDTLEDDKQFRILVSRNDRKGVAELLDSYLPWEFMAPFETRFWQDQLEFLKNPLPLDQRVLAFRGLDDDELQVGFEVLKKPTKEEAIRNQNVFFMSTLLTKNQGSWNRRLRSLSAMNEKYIGIDSIHETTEFSKVNRISNMFRRHSINPEGSPFLSFTPSIEVANTFGSQRLGAFFLDPRAIHHNYASAYAIEKEFLLPLITFPDELAAIYDAGVHELNFLKKTKDKEVIQFIKTESLNKLAHSYSKAEAQSVMDKIEKNSKEYFAFLSFKDFKNQKMGGTIDKIYFKEMGKNKIKSIQAITPDNENCAFMIKNFL